MLTVEAVAVDRSHVIRQLFALRSAVEAELFCELAAHDAGGAWRDDGAPSMQAWTSMFLGVAPETANEMVRVARALCDLPAISTAHADGTLSFDQLRPLTRFATAKSDPDLAREAPKHTTAALRRMASRAERIARERAEEQLDERSVRWRWRTDGMLRLSALLPTVEGAALVKTLDRVASRMPRDPVTGVRDPYPARCADALAALAGVRVSRDADADRATVVVHVDASALDGGAGSAHVEGGPGIAVEAAARLLCDGRVQVVAEDRDGEPVAISTTRRTLPPHLARVLRATHDRCAFPGCDHDLFIEFHHMHAHALGGETSLDNMVPVCGFHHRFVHERAWRIERGADGPRVLRADGTPFERPPPRADREARERILQLVPTPRRIVRRE